MVFNNSCPLPKIVETEIFSVDERVTIISGIIAIMGKKKERVREKQIITYFHAKKQMKNRHC